MSDQATTVICPVCDAPNASRSLFCAECGAALSDSSGDTAPISPVGNVDSQSTAVIPSSRSWSDAASARQPSVTAVSSTVEPLTLSPAMADPNPYLLPVPVAPESRRGFWLGVIALVLFLIVLGLWIWGGILAADTRESVRNLFGMS